MPKGTKKPKTRSGHKIPGHSVEADFTVYHYADADPGIVRTGRLSKGVTSWSSKAKQLSGPAKMTAAENEDNLPWYEKDLSTFDLLSDNEECSEEEAPEDRADAETVDPPITTRPVGRRRRKKLSASRGDDVGAVYPLDLWFLIGSWISPEQVGTFASICHGSHVVTHYARFWYRLYDCHYNVNATLPITLQPQSMERLHGLRARVIRAIYLMHSPLQLHLQTRAPFEQDPDSIKGACCTLIWYQQIKTHWYFYFKFLLPTNEKFTCPLVKRNKSQRNINPLHLDADIHFNPEEGNCILQVITQNFIPLPTSIMGQVLAKSGLSVSHGMKDHKLKLTFSPQMYIPQRGKSDMGGTTVILDPVLNAYVRHWWDPKYPLQPV